MGCLLEGKHLNKRFSGDHRETDALRDVCFSLTEGEFLGIAGESGCGKSTLLRVIAGLLGADSGQLFHRGREITGMGARERGQFLQMIFQDAQGSFDPRMTMLRSITESGRGQQNRDRIRELAAMVGLTEDLLSRKPGALSGGQCQRMSIIRALYSDTKILLCDEITSALDVSSQAQIVAILKQLKAQGDVSAVIVSHDIAFLMQLADRVLIMRDGAVVESGETRRIIKGAKKAYTRALIESAAKQSLQGHPIPGNEACGIQHGDGSDSTLYIRRPKE